MYIFLWHCKNELEGVVAAGSYNIYTRCLRLWTEVLGRFQGRLHYATTTTKWRRYCLRPGTLSISMVINMTIFFYFNISILKYYECSWNKPCFYPWCFYYKWRKIILSAWIYITLGFTIILTLKVILFQLFTTTMPSVSSSPSFFFNPFSFCLFFFVSCRIGYMKQPGRLSLAQSHICARGCRRSDASEPPGELLSLVKKRLVSAGLSPPCWHHYKIATDSHRNKQVRQNSHLLFIYAPQCDFCRVRLCPN